MEINKMLNRYSRIEKIGILFLIIWTPYIYSFIPIEALINSPYISSYHFIMFAISILGAYLVLKNNHIGLRLLFYSTLMYVIFRVIDHVVAIKYLNGILESPTGNALLDQLQVEYIKLKVLPNSSIPIHRKVFYFYQWGIMPIIQFILLVTLPILIIKTKKKQLINVRF